MSFQSNTQKIHHYSVKLGKQLDALYAYLFSIADERKLELMNTFITNKCLSDDDMKRLRIAKEKLALNTKSHWFNFTLPKQLVKLNETCKRVLRNKPDIYQFWEHRQAMNQLLEKAIDIFKLGSDSTHILPYSLFVPACHTIIKDRISIFTEKLPNGCDANIHALISSISVHMYYLLELISTELKIKYINPSDFNAKCFKSLTDLHFNAVNKVKQITIEQKEFTADAIRLVKEIRSNLYMQYKNDCYSEIVKFNESIFAYHNIALKDVLKNNPLKVTPYIQLLEQYQFIYNDKINLFQKEEFYRVFSQSGSESVESKLITVLCCKDVHNQYPSIHHNVTEYVVTATQEISEMNATLYKIQDGYILETIVDDERMTTHYLSIDQVKSAITQQYNSILDKVNQID